MTPAPEVHFRVMAIDGAPPTATVRIWDLPNGCLRKEDSKPKVYLIENGTKRWVTSPRCSSPGSARAGRTCGRFPMARSEACPTGPTWSYPDWWSRSSPIPYRRTALCR